MARRTSSPRGLASRWSAPFALAASVLLGATLPVACGSDNGATVGGGGGDDGGGNDGTSGDDSTIFAGGDSGDGGGGGDGSGNDAPTSPNNCVAPTSLSLTPASLTQNVTPGGTFTQTYTVMGAFASGNKDVTSSTYVTVSDPNVGTMNGATFTWGGKYGGDLTITAMYCGVKATANLVLKLSTTFASGAGSGGLSGTFGSAPASGNAACKPTLKYPPDDVLLPPNMNVIEVHFLEAGNTSFEVSFENASTDVKVYTTCTGTTAPDGMPATVGTGGCIIALTQPQWDVIANSNRGGDPLTVTVRGLGCDGGNAAASDTRKINFAQEDVVGTLYFWSTVALNSNTISGGVFRAQFGKVPITVNPVLTPTTTANSSGECIGCHMVDHEGRRMVFDYDDNNADDEYGDVFTDLWDIPSSTAVQPIVDHSKSGKDFAAGFSSWNRSASHFLLSDGYGTGAASPGDAGVQFNGPRGTFHVIDAGGVPTTKTTPTWPAGSPALRGTTPDIAPDDTKVVLSAALDQVQVGAAKPDPTIPGFWGNSDHTPPAPDGATDEFFTGAGLYVATWDPASYTMGNATAIFPAQTAGNAAGIPNFYYPSWSPDGSLIVFDSAASGPNFHNPLARVQLVGAGGGVAADQVKLNTGSPGDGANLTNSWPRWAPFIQHYKGHTLMWLTMSSTRSYGLRYDNSAAHNCYPNGNPDQTRYPVYKAGTGCSTAQLWMAAIDLDTGKIAAGGDVSHPAFWLPFQDITTNNHLGQWTQKFLSGTCSPSSPCPTGFNCDNGACSANPPSSVAPPSGAQCTQDVNCATGTCCVSGACGACPAGGGDAGVAISSCTTCLDCQGQACTGGSCGACTSSADCCYPLRCGGSGTCVPPIF